MTVSHPVTRDEYGFLTDPAAWDRGTARLLAEELGVGPLEADHWRIIDYVREHWLKYRAIHPTQQICRHFGLPARCIRERFGGLLELWKVAGLPYPGTEAYTYMVNEDHTQPPIPERGGRRLTAAA